MSYFRAVIRDAKISRLPSVADAAYTAKTSAKTNIGSPANQLNEGFVESAAIPEPDASSLSVTQNQLKQKEYLPTHSSGSISNSAINLSEKPAFFKDSDENFYEGFYEGSYEGSDVNNLFSHNQTAQDETGQDETAQDETAQDESRLAPKFHSNGSADPKIETDAPLQGHTLTAKGIATNKSEQQADSVRQAGSNQKNRITQSNPMHKSKQSPELESNRKEFAWDDTRLAEAQNEVDQIIGTDDRLKDSHQRKLENNNLDNTDFSASDSLALDSLTRDSLTINQKEIDSVKIQPSTNLPQLNKPKQNISLPSYSQTVSNQPMSKLTTGRENEFGTNVSELADNSIGKSDSAKHSNGYLNELSNSQYGSKKPRKSFAENNGKLSESVGKVDTNLIKDNSPTQASQQQSVPDVNLANKMDSLNEAILQDVRRRSAQQHHQISSEITSQHKNLQKARVNLDQTERGAASTKTKRLTAEQVRAHSSVVPKIKSSNAMSNQFSQPKRPQPQALSQPQVKIGQIDVYVQTSSVGKSVQRNSGASSSLANPHYLRSL